MVFLEEQLYSIKDNKNYQRNKSAIIMGKNGMIICTGKLGHINVCYLFTKDGFYKVEVKVEYQPTHKSRFDLDISILN